MSDVDAKARELAIQINNRLGASSIFSDEITALIKAALREAQGEWQDISTAPRDGTEILACYFRQWDETSASGYGPWTIAWDGKKWRSSWDESEVLNYMSDFGSEYKEPDCAPTHWRPLPAPPQPKPERTE